MFGSKDLLFSSETYGVAKSLRFRSGSSTYFNRTFGTPTDNKKFTISAWVKRGILTSSAGQTICGSGLVAGTTVGGLYFGGSNTFSDVIAWYDQTGAGISGYYYTNAVFRDASSWYHIVCAIDIANATSSNRCRIWVNGVLQTLTTSTAYASGASSGMNVASNIGGIGSILSVTQQQYFDGYMAELNFIDGQALTPSSFGFFDNNGIWQPQGYTGTYGTNGFYLKFTDVGATSGANSGYGKDFSGFNTNYWTTNNFGTTSTLTTYDSMYDSPVNASNGIMGIGNYAVFNPLWQGRTNAPTNGNLDYPASSVGIGTMDLSSGTYYWEITSTGGTTTAAVYGTSASASTSITTGNTVGLRFTGSTGALDYTTNGTSWTSVATGLTSGPYFIYVSTAASTTASLNCGQRPFTYSPSSVSALNTQNLPAPTITNGAAYMAAVTYTGSASTQSVTATSTNSGNNPNAVTFQPDLVWIKDRTNAQSHKLTDAVRGTTKAISTDSTAAEATDANGVTAFNNNGFSLGTGTRAYSDSNLDSYVAWQWKEGISQGFDIVSYAGDNTSNRNISHNLGVAPAFAWVKSLSTGSFYIYHQNLTGSTYFLKCNSTDGTNAQTNTNTPWGTGNWSSTQFMVTNNATNNLNASSTNYIGYLWAAIAGYSAFGTYTGNGSTNGPFIYTGFRPRFIMVKNATTGGPGYNWWLYDSSRNTYNAANTLLFPDTNLGDTSGAYEVDFLSNGFKIRTSNGAINLNTNTIIYAAFAENPFKISRAR